MDIFDSMLSLWHATGLYNFTIGQGAMIAVGCLLLFLGIVKGFEPLLLIPIGFGGILANIPVAGIAMTTKTAIAGGKVIVTYGGFLGQIYGFGVATGLFPLLIFMGVGAMTDFGPLIANPKTALLGAAAHVPQDSLDQQFSLSPIDGWLNRFWKICLEPT